MMGVELDKKYARYAAIAMRACYRSASRHPVVVLIILFTIWFYRSFPLLFSLLVYASPVIVSTSALLGTLLLYGHQNAPKIQKPHHHEIPILRFRVIEDTEFGGKEVRDEARDNDFGNTIPAVNTVNLNDDHRRVEASSRRSSIDSSVSMADRILKEEAKSEVCNHNQKTDLGGEKMAFVSHCAHFQPPQVNNTQDHKRWETGSEIGENSSRTASIAGTFPMVDDLPPLLQPEIPQQVHTIGSEVPQHAHVSNVNSIGSEVPHHAHVSNVNSYAASNHSLASGDHHDYDNENEDDDEEEEEEANVNEKEDETLKNSGKSETERNQPMENLIARKKAIRNMRIQAEENLVNINLDISYSATPHASTRRNSFDQPFDLTEPVIESAPPVIMPIINAFDLPVGPTFQPDSLSFQPNHQFINTQESFDMGPSTVSRENEGYFAYGASENVSQRSRSSSDEDDDDVAKTSNGGVTCNEKGSLSFQPNDQNSHQHESCDVGPATFGGYNAYVSEVSGYVSYSNDSVKLHQVAEEDVRHYEVKTSDGGEKGYDQGKIRSESSSPSSAFSDVTDHLDDEEDEYDFRSAFMPSTPERQIQEQRKKESPKSEHDEGRLPQRPSRVPRWFGWKKP